MKTNTASSKSFDSMERFKTVILGPDGMIVPKPCSNFGEITRIFALVSNSNRTFAKGFFATTDDPTLSFLQPDEMLETHQALILDRFAKE